MNAQIILCLGGNGERNRTAAALAAADPQALVLVSSEGGVEQVAAIYRDAGIASDRVFYDFRAWDTLTNFTLTLPWVLARRPRQLVVVTDQFHLRRSMVIARIVYALRGVALQGVAHPSPQSGESDGLVGWDRWRALVWRLSGRTIENGDRLSRMEGISAEERRARELGLQLT